MIKLNPAYVKAVKQAVNASPYFALISMTIEGLEAGHSRLGVVLEEKHLHPFGSVHGGVFASLIDAAAYWALHTEVDEGKRLTTVEMKLNFLAPARAGKLVAEGYRIQLGRTLGIGEAKVEDGEGKLLARGMGTFMIIPGEGLPQSLPPKFINLEFSGAAD